MVAPVAVSFATTVTNRIAIRPARPQPSGCPERLILAQKVNAEKLGWEPASGVADQWRSTVHPRQPQVPIAVNKPAIRVTSPARNWDVIAAIVGHPRCVGSPNQYPSIPACRRGSVVHRERTAQVHSVFDRSIIAGCLALCPKGLVHQSCCHLPGGQHRLGAAARPADHEGALEQGYHGEAQLAGLLGVEAGCREAGLGGV